MRKSECEKDETVQLTYFCMLRWLLILETKHYQATDKETAVQNEGLHNLYPSFGSDKVINPY
jgi:hypothetical protein